MSLPRPSYSVSPPMLSLGLSLLFVISYLGPFPLATLCLEIILSQVSTYRLPHPTRLSSQVTF